MYYTTNKSRKVDLEFSTIFSAALTVVSLHADAAVQSVVEPCNIAVYLHHQKLYLHSISRALCTKHRCEMVLIYLCNYLFVNPLLLWLNL